MIVLMQQPSRGKDKNKPPSTSRRTQEPAKPFEFISSDVAGRPSQTSRRTIRSHVMRGKNRAKRVNMQRDPHINLELSRLDAKSPVSSPSPPSAPSSSSSDSAERTFSAWTNTLNFKEDEQLGFNDGPRTHLVDPLSVPSYGHWGDLASVNFAAKADRRAQYLIFKFFTSFKIAMYPVEQSFRIAEFKTDWFNWLLENPTFFHASVFAYSVMEESMAGNKGLDPLAFDSWRASTISDRALSHLGQALHMLQGDLVDRWGLDSTAAVVICMISVSQSSGDDASFRAHFTALKRIIDLRGGPKTLEQSPQVLFKVLRIELSWYAKTGSPPRFVTSPPSWDSIFDDPSLSLELVPVPPDSPPAGLMTLLDTVPSELRTLFLDMRRFSIVVDAYMNSTPKLTFPSFMTMIKSVQYRLLTLSYTIDTTLQEPLRIGLLAFYSGLLAQTALSKHRLPWLQGRLKACIDSMPVKGLPGGGNTPLDAATLDLRLWLLFVGALAVFDAKEEWITDAITELIGNFQPWQDVRRRLEGVMWVESIQDVPGRRIFNLARRSSIVVAALPWRMTM